MYTHIPGRPNQAAGTMGQATPSRSLIVIGAKGARATCHMCGLGSGRGWGNHAEEAAQEFERLPDAAIQLHWLRALIGSQFSQLPAAQCTRLGTWVTAPESAPDTDRFAYYVCFHLRNQARVACLVCRKTDCIGNGNGNGNGQAK